MLITRIPPTVAELAARALAGTRFLSEIADAQPHRIAPFAEIAASLAAEQWESERHALAGATVSPDLIAEVAQALVDHAKALPALREADLYAAHAKVERAIAALAAARACTKGTLPLPAAEAFIDDIDDHFDAVRTALTRALGILETAIDAAEWARSAALAASVGAV